MNTFELFSLSRRSFFAGGAGSLLVAKADAQTSDSGPLSGRPLSPPKCDFVYESIVEISPAMDLGMGPLGARHMIPITGGSFAGPRLKGKVLPGGADRQLWRQDGVHLLNALYELQTDDGVVITVDNKVMTETRADKSHYAFSTLDITAPEGPYGWLNHMVFVGTLTAMSPKSVLIRVFSLV